MDPAPKRTLPCTSSIVRMSARSCATSSGRCASRFTRCIFAAYAARIRTGTDSMCMGPVGPALHMGHRMSLTRKWRAIAGALKTWPHPSRALSHAQSPVGHVSGSSSTSTVFVGSCMMPHTSKSSTAEYRSHTSSSPATERQVSARRGAGGAGGVVGEGAGGAIFLLLRRARGCPSDMPGVSYNRKAAFTNFVTYAVPQLYTRLHCLTQCTSRLHLSRSSGTAASTSRA